LFPELWRAKIGAMQADRMLLQEYERMGNQANPRARVLKQEWAVQGKENSPAVMAETAHRTPA
jgi:hypothetical protein